MSTQNNVHPLLDPAQNSCQEISDPERLCKAPLVSVGMITYNHEHYIGEAIEDVVSPKTDFPFELLIGEDCLTAPRAPSYSTIRNAIRTSFACSSPNETWAHMQK
jgi:hypothetical protein